jgi:hypothetical protein
MESIFGVTLELSICSKCGAPHTEGCHDLAIASLENVFMEQGGRGVELADEIDRRRKLEHKFAPKQIPTRWIGEQHVLEDLGLIPAATKWLERIEPVPWMQRSRRLSIELEEEDVRKAEMEEERQVS